MLTFGAVRLLDLVKPFLPILPEVEAPYQKVQYDEKLLWLGTVGILYYILNELPLFGVKAAATTADPLFWLRPVLASTKGTLTELGLLPIITSGFILQLLGGNHLIDVNFDLSSDRELFQSAQKLLAFFLALAQAFAIVFSGAYGTTADLGTSGVFWLVLQIFGGSAMLILLAEVLEKGYGFGSGVSFYTTLHVCQLVFWRALSFSWETIGSGRGAELVGAFTSFGHMIWTRNFKTALLESFYRSHLPNLFEIYGYVITFGLVVYLLNLRLDIPVKSSKVKSPASVYPIRLLYTGGLPVYIIALITANIFIFSVALYSLFPNNLLVQLLGTWQAGADTPQLFAVSGLSYYLQPPFTIKEALWDPIKSIFYALFVVITCTVFARNWTDISGYSSKDIAKSFKSQGIIILGHRDNSSSKELKRIIPVAAAIGGAIAGAIIVAFDLLGTSGIGATILVGATAIYGFFEILVQENGGYPSLAGLL